jgi:hypothetical protein
MNINKVMISVFFIVINSMACAMELEKSQDVKRTRPKDIVNRSAESSSPAYSLSFGVPSVASLLNGASSLVTTFNNYWYDEEAFKKLGWPENDEVAQGELVKTLAIYDRVNAYFQTRKAYIDLVEDRRAIGRRYGYCQRVLETLPQIPKRAEALELATFCLKYHSQAMNDFIKSDFLLFVSVETGKSTRETQKAVSEVAQLKIVPENNVLLNDLALQTAREVVKKEEEEKKRKEKEEQERLEKEEKKRKEKEEESKKDDGKKEQKSSKK